jgi:hypothetical protein
MNTHVLSLNPKDLQDLLEQIEASRSWRKCAWEKFAEIRWALKDTTGVELPPPAGKTIDIEGRNVKGRGAENCQGRPSDSTGLRVVCLNWSRIAVRLARKAGEQIYVFRH